ncbi:unnamed protein product [Rhizoctonia solani]|uniref:Transmembrane protein n=1 Tax=Rhizoctonia solani TaxID=456999 RepID=A0A8H3BM55_9AGAM|nr:unnamed protein product [Rhizoctonia solani]
MLAFSRLASFLLFVLSLSFLTCAAPTPMSDDLIAREGVRDNDDLLLAAVIDLRTKCYNHAEAIDKIDDSLKLIVKIDSLVKEIGAVADVIAKVKLADADAKVKADIAAHLLVVLKAVIKICAHLIAKLDLKAALDLIVKVQAALKLLIDNLEISVSGFVDIFVKIIPEAELKAMANVHLDALVKLCVSATPAIALNV